MSSLLPLNERGALSDMKRSEFDECFFEAVPAVRRFLRRRGCAWDVVHDVEQDTFVQATIDRGRFDPSRGSFEAWVQAIALNVLRNRERSNRTDRRGLSFRAEWLRRRRADAERSATKRRDEPADYVEEAFQRLPASEQRLLSETLIEGRSPAEIASGDPRVRANTIAQRARRARAHLRSMFTKVVGS